jgi:3-oxoacyl-[acyl-carrier protein] reductase
MNGSKVVLLTGAGGGLGRALAEAFEGSGWQVAAGSREPKETDSPAILPVRLDVTRPDHVQEAIGAVLQKFGRVDVLVNNAGITADAACGQLSDEDWQRVLDVNLRGAFLCARAVARPMTRQRDGHIINISSFAARSGPRGQSNYAAAKAGLIGLTQSLAQELGSRNVRVNAILPGVLPTNMTARLTPEQKAAFAQANALGRINDVGEVARFIVFLAATQNISGQIFQLDSRVARWT